MNSPTSSNFTRSVCAQTAPDRATAHSRMPRRRSEFRDLMSFLPWYQPFKRHQKAGRRCTSPLLRMVGGIQSPNRASPLAGLIGIGLSDAVRFRFENCVFIIPKVDGCWLPRCQRGLGTRVVSRKKQVGGSWRLLQLHLSSRIAALASGAWVGNEAGVRTFVFIGRFGGPPRWC
jgi:hypothetical protein